MGRSPYAAGGSYHVFVSFSGRPSREAGSVLVKWIDEILKSEVRAFFYGPDHVVIGEDWLKHVYEGAADSDAFVSFLTRDNVTRHWIREELEAASASSRCRMILLILLDGLQPHELPPDLHSRQAKTWSVDLLRNLLVLFGREARISGIEDLVKGLDDRLIAESVTEAERTGRVGPPGLRRLRGLS